MSVPASNSLLLTCHPATPCPAIRRVEVTLAPAADGALHFRYRVSADAGELLLPPVLATPAAPTDGLWQHTCCEAFLSRVGESSYREFNFSPSGAWASYAFADTRLRQPAAEPAWQAPPEIDVRRSADGFELGATLPASQMPPGAGALCLGLSVVLETRDSPRDAGATRLKGSTGSILSYWALHHPAAQPDFHHRDAFSLLLD